MTHTTNTLPSPVGFVDADGEYHGNVLPDGRVYSEAQMLAALAQSAQAPAQQFRAAPSPTGVGLYVEQPAQPAPSCDPRTCDESLCMQTIRCHAEHYRKHPELSARAEAAVEALALDRADAYRAGWCAAARWADRDDLLSDTDSPAYIKDRDEALARGER